MIDSDFRTMKLVSEARTLWNRRLNEIQGVALLMFHVELQRQSHTAKAFAHGFLKTFYISFAKLTYRDNVVEFLDS